MIQQQDEEGGHTKYRKHGGTVVDDLAREAMHQPLVFLRHIKVVVHVVYIWG